MPYLKRLIILIKNEYDIYFADEPFANGLFALFISSIKNKPLVIALRGWADLTNEHNEYNSLKFFFLKLISNFVLSKAQNTIAISKATVTQLKKMYNIKNFRVIERPIDTKYYSSGKRITRYSTPTIITVTNLRYKNKFKGVAEIIEVIDEIREQMGDLTLLIAGGGRYLKELKKFAKKFNFVKILGFRRDIPDILALGDVFVYISYLDSYPTVILEAQAAGLPVICNDYGGVPEACGWAGFIVKNKKELKKTLLYVLSNRKIQKKLKHKSLKRIQKYNITAAKKYMRVWNETIR